ncbi:hypothetical protein ACVR0A_09065 [Streptococcus downei]|uniref:Sugar ABC transporter permease n=1 Tax=Streptococcus downei MFe28 TaxID=764290 RepID=A0A380JC86_STRDO|nr:hypothetical protein [Streptococcus downei]EFQ58324.1 hypothetical protein HMPREF9176_0703 [Streptococcus downei F0415]SUN35419.1 sugar ABC transporter permease [Streptococcus downei MFe28]
MKEIFPAVFESVWRRKETKIYLVFALYPLVYFVASFFGHSNFMQIVSGGGVKVGYMDFADMMLNAVDTMMLPTLALFFLTISVFKRETDDHTMFLYKDINRKNIFFAKFFSLILILIIYLGTFLLISLFVHYTRVVHTSFGTYRFTSDSLYNSLMQCVGTLVLFLKGALSIAIAAFLSLRSNVGMTMVSAICLSITMMITQVIGGPIAALFPNGYNQFATSLNNIWIGLLGPLVITLIYVTALNHFSWKKFGKLEF